jgi:hypothetical protein
VSSYLIEYLLYLFASVCVAPVIVRIGLGDKW